jgi:alcohol dehydrogenase (NADP+)
VTGHEVIGKVVEVGKAVKEFKVGQRVGVGAQVGSCGKCKACKTGLGKRATAADLLDMRGHG